jgi:hypothetical protein
MTFREQLRAHLGGIVRLKTQLYWYNSDYWDGIEGRVCLILDVDPAFDALEGRRWHAVDEVSVTAHTAGSSPKQAIVLLFIDGALQKIWLSEDVVEFIK